MAEEIKRLAPEAVWGYFYDLTQIPRPTGHTKQVTDYLKAFGEKHGLETHQDEVGNVLIRKPATPGYEGRQTVVLQAHVDMVPQKNAGVAHDFLRDPIDAYIDGEWVTARDTTLGADNGMGVSLAMAALTDKTIKHGPLEGLFTIDEEVGMDGAVGLKPGFLKGTIMINGDSEEEGRLFVGCAGGVDMNITFHYRDGEPTPEGDVALRLTLAGLKGGHSGVDIHLGRANANKLFFRFLKKAVSHYDVRLATVEGGSLRNAIPREVSALVTVPADRVADVEQLVREYEALYRAEYKGVEGDIRFTAERTPELPATLIPEEIQDDLINAVEGCPNGPISMLHDFPGTVESSSNLAIVKSDDAAGRIDVKILVRSSSESRKDALCSSIESVFSLAGAKVEQSNPYGGWQPNIDSPILRTMEKAYESLFGRKPDVTVMHAGLECGIIQEAYPDMDMISFGPDIKHPHSPDEAVGIASVEKSWRLLVATLEAVPEK